MWKANYLLVLFGWYKKHPFLSCEIHTLFSELQRQICKEILFWVGILYWKMSTYYLAFVNNYGDSQ